MKRKILFSFVSTLFLVGCNTPKPASKTYTITFDSAEHFTPSQTSVTFNKDDFSPIVVSYTIDEDYRLLNAKPSLESAECVINRGDENTITITPHENANFKITPNVTHFSLTSAIRITGDSHFKPDRPTIVYKKGDVTPITVSYTIDEYCSISESGIVVEGDKATCVADQEKLILTITPKPSDAQEHIRITITSTENYKVVNFNPGDGQLGDKAEESIKMPYGKTWEECIFYGEQCAVKNPWDFAGWSFASGGRGELIDGETVIDENTPSMVYAVYYHRIYLNSSSLGVESLAYDNNNLVVTLKLIDSRRYVIPEQSELKNHFIISGSGQLIDDAIYNRTSDNEITISIAESKIMWGQVNIIVSDLQPSYNAGFSGGDHLGSTFPSHVNRGDDIKFTITAKNDTNGIYYYVPDELSINIDDGNPLSSNAYDIAIVDGDRQKANVIIYGEYISAATTSGVTHHVSVHATPGTVDGYYCSIAGYGVTVPATPPGYIISDHDVVLEVTGDGAALVKKENVGIKINNSNWYVITTLPAPFNEVISYSEDTHKITIKENDCEQLRSVSFHVFNPNYSVFENATWDQIDELSYTPFARQLFAIGETKTLKVYYKNGYKARIIGFNHDTITDQERKAGLTIELTQLLNDSKNELHKDKFSEGLHCDYEDAQYDTFLNNDFISAIDNDLRRCIKTVNKPSWNHAQKRIKTLERQVFALSMREFNWDPGDYTNTEGTPYEYYKQEGSSRVKCDINVGDPHDYWSRSIWQGGRAGNAFYVKSSGGHDDRGCGGKVAYMAAFCI